MATMYFVRQMLRSVCVNRRKTPYPSYCTVNAIADTVSPLAEQSQNNLEHLKTRALVELNGPDASRLLQGLITNDIFHMPQGRNKLSCIFAMFLNSKGRILCDSLIYSLDKNSYIVEADEQIIEQLVKHIKMYRLKRQVDIQRLDSYKVYALYDPNTFMEDRSPIPQIIESLKEPLSTATKGTICNDMYIFCDPRMPALGCRILTKTIDKPPIEFGVEKMNPPSNGINFRWLRYSLGVGEGVVDIPPQISFPLEHNCDYMNGLNLHKGCYLGQELTARTYHTGKVRKRLMPLFLRKKLDPSPSVINIFNDRRQSLGKLRGIQFNAALALLRMHLVIDVDINMGGTKAVTKIPHWWPGFKTVKLQAEITNKRCL